MNSEKMNLEKLCGDVKNKLFEITNFTNANIRCDEFVIYTLTVVIKLYNIIEMILIYQDIIDEGETQEKYADAMSYFETKFQDVKPTNYKTIEKLVKKYLDPIIWSLKTNREFLESKKWDMIIQHLLIGMIFKNMSIHKNYMYIRRLYLDIFLDYNEDETETVNELDEYLTKNTKCQNNAIVISGDSNITTVDIIKFIREVYDEMLEKAKDLPVGNLPVGNLQVGYLEINDARAEEAEVSETEDLEAEEAENSESEEYVENRESSFEDIIRRISGNENSKPTLYEKIFTILLIVDNIFENRMIDSNGHDSLMNVMCVDLNYIFQKAYKRNDPNCMLLTELAYTFFGIKYYNWINNMSIFYDRNNEYYDNINFEYENAQIDKDVVFIRYVFSYFTFELNTNFKEAYRPYTYQTANGESVTEMQSIGFAFKEDAQPRYTYITDIVLDLFSILKTQLIHLIEQHIEVVFIPQLLLNNNGVANQQQVIEIEDEDDMPIETDDEE